MIHCDLLWALIYRYAYLNCIFCCNFTRLMINRGILRTCFILVMSLVSKMVLGTGTDLDSSLLAFEKMKNGPAKVQLGKDFSNAFLAEKQYEESNVFAEKTLVQAQMLQDTPNMAWAYQRLGINAFRQLQPYDAVSVYFLRGLNLYEALGDSAEISWCHLQLGLVDYSLADHKQAADHFSRSIAVGGNSEQVSTARYLLGLSYSELGEFEKASELLHASLDDYAANDPERELSVRAFLGKLKFNRGDYKGSIDYLEDAIKQYPSPSDSQSLCVPRAYLAMAYYWFGDMEQAIYNGRFVVDYADITSGVTYWIEASKILHQALAKEGEYG